MRAVMTEGCTQWKVEEKQGPRIQSGGITGPFTSHLYCLKSVQLG